LVQGRRPGRGPGLQDALGRVQALPRAVIRALAPALLSARAAVVDQAGAKALQPPLALAAAGPALTPVRAAALTLASVLQQP
jgi:hypothetical protein